MRGDVNGVPVRGMAALLSALGLAGSLLLIRSVAGLAAEQGHDAMLAGLILYPLSCFGALVFGIATLVYTFELFQRRKPTTKE